MDENKNYENNEELTAEEAVEEAVEDVAEEIAEVDDVIDEVTEEAAENIDEALEEAAEAIEEELEALEEMTEAPKKSKNGIIAAVLAVAVVVAAVAALILYEPNKYNKQYIDITGTTLQDLLDQDGGGMTLEEFIKQNGLPEDMPANTHINAAQNNIKMSFYAEMAGMDFEAYKQAAQLPEGITETSTLGDAMGELTLKEYVGEENIEQFKTEYSLGEEVTGDTKFKEVRDTVDKVRRDQYRQQMKEAEEAEKAAEESAETPEAGEVPAEGEALAEGEAPAEGDAAEPTAAPEE